MKGEAYACSIIFPSSRSVENGPAARTPWWSSLDDASGGGDGALKDRSSRASGFFPSSSFSCRGAPGLVLVSAHPDGAVVPGGNLDPPGTRWLSSEQTRWPRLSPDLPRYHPDLSCFLGSDWPHLTTVSSDSFLCIRRLYSGDSEPSMGGLLPPHWFALCHPRSLFWGSNSATIAVFSERPNEKEGMIASAVRASRLRIEGMSGLSRLIAAMGKPPQGLLWSDREKGLPDRFPQGFWGSRSHPA